jgi:hypothetical protein
LFSVVLVLILTAARIGLSWVPRLPTARELEEPPDVVVQDARAAAGAAR